MKQQLKQMSKRLQNLQATCHFRTEGKWVMGIGYW
jgi:hypothetical protein